MQLDQLIGASAAPAVAIARGVRPDQLGAPTPCREWDVRTLANHLVQVAGAVNLAGHGEPIPDDYWQRGLLTGDWAGWFEAQVQQAVAAWAKPEAQQGMVRMGAAEMPAPMVAAMLASDLVIHGWDLAQATGQTYHCDEAAAEAAYRFVSDTAAQGQEMGLYGAPLPVPEDAPALERVLRLSGRSPEWAS